MIAPSIVLCRNAALILLAGLLGWLASHIA
jgi:hypothetical protein